MVHKFLFQLIKEMKMQRFLKHYLYVFLKLREYLSPASMNVCNSVYNINQSNIHHIDTFIMAGLVFVSYYI